MKGVVFGGDRKIEFRDFSDPVPGPGEVVLEIKASGMCGSDLKLYRATFVSDRRIGVDDLFTHRWKLEQADEAYKQFDKQTSGKGVFVM